MPIYHPIRNPSRLLPAMGMGTYGPNLSPEAAEAQCRSWGFYERPVRESVRCADRILQPGSGLEIRQDASRWFHP